MALGNVTNEVQTGGRSSGATAADLARTVVCLNVSPGGTPDTVYSFSSESSAKGTLGAVGPLAEQVCKLIQHGAGQVYAVPLTPSSATTSASAVTQVGSGQNLAVSDIDFAPHKPILIYCVTGGTIATCTFKFSLDGGTTYGPVTASADSGGGSWVYRVPGTFTTLTFAAATYVATKTCTVAVTGTVTNGSLWVGTVTQASSAVDAFDVKLTIVTGGAHSSGSVVVRPSLDGGTSTLPDVAVGSGAQFVIPNTGIAVTLSSGTYVADDTYSFYTAPPGYSTSDITSAMTALRGSNAAPQVAVIHVGGMPTAVAGAVSAGSTLATAISTAESSNGKFYAGVVECPYAGATGITGDTVVSASAAVIDTADTDSAIRTAILAATETNHVSIFVASHKQTSAISGYKLRRPSGWAVMARYVEADPVEDVAEVGRGALDVYTLGRDEFTAGTSLHDAKVNVLRSYPGRSGAYVAIQSGNTGWRNMTSDADYQDAGAVRLLLVFLNAITVAGQKYLGSRQATNSDGTIAESAAQAIDADLDGVAKRTVGLLKGGDFPEPQASAAAASVDRDSQLGAAPKRLDVNYSLQPLGQITAVRNRVAFSGVLPISA